MIVLQTEIKFGLPEDKELRAYKDEEIAEGMDLELGEFQRWFMSKGNGALIGPERAILKTYLAWKALYAETDVDPQAGGRDDG
jgi:hypothetical protein